MKGHSEIITTFQYFDTNPNMMVSGSLDRSIRIWKNGQTAAVMTDHADWIRCLSLSNDNLRLLSGCVSSHVCGWDLTTKKILFRLQHSQQTV